MSDGRTLRQISRDALETAKEQGIVVRYELRGNEQAGVRATIYWGPNADHSGFAPGDENVARGMLGTKSYTRNVMDTLTHLHRAGLR